MEKKVSLFITESQVSFVTDNFKGLLDSIIIDSINKVDILIESSLGYLLLKEKDLIGNKYICTRCRTQAPEPSLFDYPSFEKFNLNEPLIITISGMRNTKVDFIFRIC
jgi:hypothetical protein